MPRPVTEHDKRLLSLDATDMDTNDVCLMLKLACELANRAGVAMQELQPRETRHRSGSAWDYSVAGQCDIFRASERFRDEMKVS